MDKNKHLSIKRLFLSFIVLLGFSYMLINNLYNWSKEIKTQAFKPWFAPYVDVTAKPRYAFEQIGDSNSKNIVLSFIVSSKENACVPTWGGAYTLDEANVVLDLDRRIARVRQQGGGVAISFGGLLNDELSVNCFDKDKLRKAYKSVIDRYNIDTIDLDIEGEDLKNTESLRRRAETIANLQKELREENKSLAVWLTLPVLPQGLTEDGTNAVAQMLEKGVDLAGVNVMTMDYGASKNKKQSMQEASQKALTQTHRQLGILYKQAGINLSDNSLWKKIGATPMIGQNDVAGEIFTLQDAKGFSEFAVEKKIGRMSMWSLNRDIQCGENYVNTNIVSDSCSGIPQEKYIFSNTLGSNFDGDLRSNASITTTENVETKPKKDIPEESPYQIWTEEGTYLQETKVVWHQNVYKAKWWNQGELPDNPVLQVWETPWQLVGPVLPGEKPIPQPTLPAGTYENWNGTSIYDVGDRILFNGIPYQAKWWTQGDSPAAATSNPNGSPWTPLSREQVDKIIEEQ